MKREAGCEGMSLDESLRRLSYSGSVKQDQIVSRGRRITPTPRGSFTDLAGLFARGYLRLLAKNESQGRPTELP